MIAAVEWGARRSVRQAQASVDPAGSLCYLLPVARNIDRKELKNPDQFVSFWTRVAAVVSAKRKVLIGGAVGAIVVTAGIWTGQNQLARRAGQQSRDLGRIERIAEASLLPSDPNAPKPADDGLPHFKTEGERLGAALGETDAFLAAHPRAAIADEAKLLKAKYLLALGKTADAVALYKSLTATVDKRLRFLAQEGLGYALEANGQVDEAIAAFNVLADDAQNAGGFYRDRALFHKARLLVRKGDPKEGGKLYHEILDKTPTSVLRDEINDRLAALEGK